MLDPEHEEDAVDETLLPVEVPTAIRLVHFVFGCAVLLPWNGLCLQNYLSVEIDAHFPQQL